MAMGGYGEKDLSLPLSLSSSWPSLGPQNRSVWFIYRYRLLHSFIVAAEREVEQEKAREADGCSEEVADRLLSRINVFIYSKYHLCVCVWSFIIIRSLFRCVYVFIRVHMSRERGCHCTCDGGRTCQKTFSCCLCVVNEFI